MKRFISVLVFAALAVAAFAQEQTAKYEIKSGIVKTVTDMMGQKVEGTLYFDNYGAQEATVTKMATPAGEMEVSTIVKDGKTYMVNKTIKQVQELPVPESINYLDITDSAREQYKIAEAGTEEILGKECTKYTEVVEQMGQKLNATVWVWKGFPIKTEMEIQGMKITTEVVEFTENAIVLPYVFEVPTF